MSKNSLQVLAAVCAFTLSLSVVAHADLINMQNGERYIGKVVTVSNETVIVQSDTLGTLSVPRAKIASIDLGTNHHPTTTQAFVPAVQSPPVAPTPSAIDQPIKSDADLAAAIRQLRANTNAIAQVQQQILSGADSKAGDLYNQTINGLMNGTVSINDIRAQAKSAADQLRAAKKELGDDSGFALDGYLAVLDGFLRETASVSNNSTNTTALKPKDLKLLDDD